MTNEEAGWYIGASIALAAVLLLMLLCACLCGRKRQSATATNTSTTAAAPAVASTSKPVAKSTRPAPASGSAGSSTPADTARAPALPPAGSVVTVNMDEQPRYVQHGPSGSAGGRVGGAVPIASAGVSTKAVTGSVGVEAVVVGTDSGASAGTSSSAGAMLTPALSSKSLVPRGGRVVPVVATTKRDVVSEKLHWWRYHSAPLQ